MVRVVTFLRGVAAIGILSASLHIGPASAAGHSGKSISSPQLQTPGERKHQLPQISIDAIRALDLIMRTENKQDPTYLESRRVVSDAVAKRLALDPIELNRAWSRAPRDHQTTRCSLSRRQRRLVRQYGLLRVIVVRMAYRRRRYATSSCVTT
jgi:hypothetical protein